MIAISFATGQDLDHPLLREIAQVYTIMLLGHCMPTHLGQGTIVYPHSNWSILHPGTLAAILYRK